MWKKKNSLLDAALVALCSVGCATFRMPASAQQSDFAPVRGIVAEPQIDLWVESGEEVLPSETTSARRAAKEALEKALEARRIAPGPFGAEDPVMIVREKAVARTDSRRHNQTVAKVAIVVGFVVVVAAIVAIVVAGKDKAPPPVALPKKAP